MRLPRTARKAVRAKSKHGKAAHEARSSLANPKISRHRDAVATRLGSGHIWGEGESSHARAAAPIALPSAGLTREMLSRFDANQRETMMDQMSLRLEPMQDDEESVGGAPTFRSLASNLTKCSNPSFERVLKAWSGHSEQQNTVLAMLAGLTQVINEKGGKGSNVEYFALLINGLETFDDTENLAAAVFLLKLVIGRVSETVLRKEFPRISKNLVKVLSENQSNGASSSLPDSVSVSSGRAQAKSYDASLIKSTLACLGILLRVQDWVVWSSASTRAVFQCLLRFIVDTRARVRKAAHLSVISILKTGEEKGKPHPAGADAVKYILPISMGATASRGSDSSKQPLWALGLLGSLLPYLSAGSLQEVCERVLLPLMAQPSHPMVRLHAIRALHGLFAGFPSEERLPAERNAKLLTALYEMQPPKNSEDISAMKAWLTTARAGIINLFRLGRPRLVAPHLAKLFPLCVDLLSSAVTAMHAPACHAALRLLDDVLRELLEHTEARPPAKGDAMAELLNVQETTKLLLQLLTATRAGLGYQFVAAWPLVLKLLAAIVNMWGHVAATAEREGGRAAKFWTAVEAGEFGEALRASLRHLSSMRDEHVESKRRVVTAEGVTTAPVGGEHLKADLERILGAAVASLGPQEFLRLVPLNMTKTSDGDLDLTRSWVIPLLLSHGLSSKRNTSLVFFFDQLRPLAERFFQLKEEAKAEVVDAENPGSKVRLLETLYLQLWSLLPVFCTRPNELFSETFMTVAGKKKPVIAHALQALVDRLSKRPELRRHILSAIRRLVTCEKRLIDDKVESAPGLMKRYAKNVLPTLFNLYLDLINSPDGVAVIDTVRAYVAIAPDDQLVKLYESGRTRLAEETAEVKRRALFDLMIAMLPFLPEAELTTAMQRDCLDAIKGQGQAAEQKKAYRMLEEVVASSGVGARGYVDAQLSSLLRALMGSQDACQEASQKPRLRAIAGLLDRLPAAEVDATQEEAEALVRDFLAEATAAVRASNSDARRAARALLSQLALLWHRTVRGRGGEEEEEDEEDEEDEERATTLTEMLALVTAGMERIPAGNCSPEANHLSLVTIDAACVLVRSEPFRACVSGDHVRQIVHFCTDRLVSSANQTVARAGLRAILDLLAATGASALPVDAVMAALGRLREAHRRPLRFDVKAVLLKMLRRVGSAVLLETIPDFLRFPFVKMAKTELRSQARREARKDARGARQGPGADEEGEEEAMEAELQESGVLPRYRHAKSLDQLLDESEGEEEEVEEGKGAEATGKTRRRARKAQEDDLWLEEAPGEVLDLMSSSVAKRIHTKAPVTAAALDAKKRKEEFPMSEDGRLIIEDPGDESDSDMDEDEDDFGALPQSSKGATSAPVPHVRPWRTKAKRKEQREPGEEYRSARALGDMKKAKGHDPHTFLKLRGVSKKDLAVLMKKKKTNRILGKGKLLRKKGKK